MKYRFCLTSFVRLLAISLSCPIPVAHAGSLSEQVAYAFTGGSDGAQPNGDLAYNSSGTIFGTAASGGLPNYGTVFKLFPNGKFTVLHSFIGGADGASPLGGLVMDVAGNLFGTTAYGGSSGDGEIFRIASDGSFSVLYNFTGGADGSNPIEQLVRDGAGNLYGIAGGGGSGAGVVFKLTPKGTLTTLHSFTGAVTDGALPLSSLLFDGHDLYGNTYYGGLSGAGTVFRLSPTGQFALLHSFNGTDGGYPNHSRLARDKSGNLFGVTKDGGPCNCGVAFKLAPDGTETMVHAFTNTTTDGGYPLGGVVLDALDNLYGTTANGGSAGEGVTFKLTPKGKETIVSFTGSNGSLPQGGLERYRRVYFGSTQYGGTVKFGGTIFQIRK